MMLVPDHYDKGIAGYLHHYKTSLHLCSNAFDGIPELLAVLQNKQVRMAMVTGKGRHSTAISLRQFGLAGYFERIETRSPAGARKAEGIQMLNAWPGITKQEVIYVGDAPATFPPAARPVFP